MTDYQYARRSNIKLLRYLPCSFIVLLGVGLSWSASSKTINLPAGIGLWQYSYRSYNSMDQKLDRDGYLETIGDGFEQNLSGPQFLENTSSKDLARLADELRKFDYAGSRSGIVDSLSLGTFKVDVDAEVSAHIIGFGYGFTDFFTGFFGVPIIDVSVKTDMYLDGSNTAESLKRRLGDLSYEELRDGLDTASVVDVTMVQDALYDMGYSGIDSWDHTGIGDLNLGGIFSKEFHPVYQLGMIPYLKWTLTIPTGYTDDPDILTDTSTGSGYVSNKFQLGHIFNIYKYLHVGAEIGYAANNEYQSEVRRPESSDSTLAPSENKQTITISPGNSGEKSIFWGLSYFVLSVEYKIQSIQTASSQVKSEDAQVFTPFVENTEKEELSEIISVGISTAELFESGAFPIPFMLTAYKKSNISGKNIALDDYFEIELASFFKFF